MRLNARQVCATPGLLRSTYAERDARASCRGDSVDGPAASQVAKGRRRIRASRRKAALESRHAASGEVGFNELIDIKAALFRGATLRDWLCASLRPAGSLRAGSFTQPRH